MFVYGIVGGRGLTDWVQGSESRWGFLASQHEVVTEGGGKRKKGREVGGGFW